MDYYEIGQRIRKVRKAHGWSQEELAEKIGISTTHMSHIETGNTKLSLPVLVSLSEAMEVQTDDLIFGKTERSRNNSLSEIDAILDSCSFSQLKIITDIIRTTKISLEKHITK